MQENERQLAAPPLYATHRISGGADLHTHTTASDGMEAPADNVHLAQLANLQAIAITDHDTIAGISEALIAGEQFGVEVIPGIEINTIEAGVDIHVLGYFIDAKNAILQQRLVQLRLMRQQRNEMLVEKLTTLGIPLTMQQVIASCGRSFATDESIGRGHIAHALVQRGIVSSVEEAFIKYLGVQGKAYVNPLRIRPHEAITWIHEAGGVAVFAHPAIYGCADVVVQLLATLPWDGIEVWHSDHTPKDIQHYATLAKQHQLIKTAGSDFHGMRQHQVFHGALGSQRIDYKIVQQLRKRAEDRQRKC